MTNLSLYSKFVVLSLFSALFLLACGGQKQLDSNSSKVKLEEPKSPIIKKTADKTKDKKEDGLMLRSTNMSNLDTIKRKKVTRFGDDNESHFPTKIQFINGKVIDIRDVDPYAVFPAKELKTWSGGLERLYDLNELNSLDSDNIFRGMRLNKDAYCTKNYLRLMTKMPCIEIAGGKTIIAYQAALYCSEEEIKGTQGFALVYNDEGELMHTIDDKKDGFYDIRLSSDGKYLMQKYGYDYGEGGDGQLDRGFRFYDTGTGEMVFDWELGKDKHIGGYDMFFDKNIALYFRNEFPNHELFYLHVQSGSVYKKSMDLKRYLSDNDYRKKMAPTFSKTRNLEDLIIDGFKKIN